eukprot:CAMPEP_0174255882 /NCGR_PEP_ID=MMETSP0439-20130205/5166_1 /TAXON_ID=0 /ORGANISM="Stereomyxa ramosa, Strain Chinc5" /LENGTH=423 /DNA_ID=CAMNT_0015338255 /DNA_START=240 /DNA_END=1511 /DNA_ORIENTATION=-
MNTPSHLYEDSSFAMPTERTVPDKVDDLKTMTSSHLYDSSFALPSGTVPYKINDLKKMPYSHLYEDSRVATPNVKPVQEEVSLRRQHNRVESLRVLLKVPMEPKTKEELENLANSFEEKMWEQHGGSLEEYQQSINQKLKYLEDLSQAKGQFQDTTLTTQYDEACTEHPNDQEQAGYEERRQMLRKMTFEYAWQLDGLRCRLKPALDVVENDSTKRRTVKRVLKKMKKYYELLDPEVYENTVPPCLHDILTAEKQIKLWLEDANSAAQYQQKQHRDSQLHSNTIPHGVTPNNNNNTHPTTTSMSTSTTSTTTTNASLVTTEQEKREIFEKLDRLSREEIEVYLQDREEREKCVSTFQQLKIGRAQPPSNHQVASPINKPHSRRRPQNKRKIQQWHQHVVPQQQQQQQQKSVDEFLPQQQHIEV